MELSSNNVLLVGHNHGTRRVLQLALNLAGYGVYMAESSSDARRLIDEHWPKAVILDVGSGSADILGLAREIRRSLHRRMVILASAPLRYADQERAAYDAGCDAFVLQPGETRELTDMLEAFLPGQLVDIAGEVELHRWN
jgi:DNA-binding response OmpR family regulator